MNTPSFKLHSLIVVSALAGFASPSQAQPRSSLTITLHVCDDPGIRSNVVARAQEEMSVIYRNAGVDITWTAMDPEGPEPSDRPLTLVVLCRDLIDKWTNDPTALGAAVGTRDYRGRMAYVFYDRVERTAQTYLNVSREPGADDLYTVILLAHAMAHEIGHLLLPYGHTATGLMRAEWDAKDLRLAVDRGLNFTSQQGELMLGQIEARLTDTPDAGRTDRQLVAVGDRDR